MGHHLPLCDLSTGPMTCGFKFAIFILKKIQIELISDLQNVTKIVQSFIASQNVNVIHNNIKIFKIRKY